MTKVLKSGFVVDNPVARARELEQLEDSVTPGLRVLTDQVEAMQSRLNSMNRALQYLGATIQERDRGNPRKREIGRLVAAAPPKEILDAWERLNFQTGRQCR